MVRPGITLYGVYPAEYLEKEIDLLPVLSFKSKIIQIKDIPKGEGISYGRTYITKKQTKIGVIPVGYADGYPRLLSNKAYVLIKGKRAKILGRVTMDFIIADISEIEGVKVGDEVVLIGKQNSQEISVWELAKLAETIPYEIFTNLNKVLLKDEKSNKILPIWVGYFEAQAILFGLENIQTPRPLTHDLLKSVISSLGATLESIIIDALADNVFYAKVCLNIDSKSIKIDSRPSDAIALALKMQAPIFVSEPVLSSATAPPGPIDDKEVEEFKEKLKTLKPKDIYEY
jgi:bifunctional DNase/RNase